MAAEVFVSDLKTLRARTMRGAPAEVSLMMGIEVPFAEERGPIIQVIQIFRYRFFYQRKIESVGWRFEWCFTFDLLKTGLVFCYEFELQTSGSFPGKNRSSRGGADGRGGISPLEFQSVSSERVDVRSAMPRMLIAAEIRPSQIIREDQQDIRRDGLGVCFDSFIGCDR